MPLIMSPTCIAALILTGSLGIVTLATLSYIASGYRPEVRFPVVASLLLIAALLAFSPMLFIATDLKLRAAFEAQARASAEACEPTLTTPKDVVQAWIQSYGTDTAQAAALTTDHFRNGRQEHAWAKTMEAALQDIGYAHLGGEVINETIDGDSAVVILQARIAAVDGISTQREIYTLKRLAGQWYIDAVEVTDERIPGGKHRHGV